MLTWLSLLVKEKFCSRNTNQYWYLKTSKFSTRRGSLLQTAWFNIVLHFRKRGQENMREMTAEDIHIHKWSSGLEYITLVERVMKNHQGGLNSNEKWGCSCHVRDAGKSSLSCGSCEDVLDEAKQAMSSPLAKAKKPQSNETRPCRRCLVLQCTARNAQVGEPSLWNVQKGRIGYYLHFTLFESQFCNLPEGIQAGKCQSEDSDWP